MPMSAAQRVAVTERRTEAVRLAVSGMDYTEIASRLGYHDRSGAYKAVQASLAAHRVEAVEELRTLEVDRLDALQQALWADAHAGNLKAVDAIVRIIQARVKLLGLDRPDAQATGARDRVVVDPADLPAYLATSRR